MGGDRPNISQENTVSKYYISTAAGATLSAVPLEQSIVDAVANHRLSAVQLHRFTAERRSGPTHSIVHRNADAFTRIVEFSGTGDRVSTDVQVWQDVLTGPRQVEAHAVTAAFEPARLQVGSTSVRTDGISSSTLMIYQHQYDMSADGVAPDEYRESPVTTPAADESLSRGQGFVRRPALGFPGPLGSTGLRRGPVPVCEFRRDGRTRRIRG